MAELGVEDVGAGAPGASWAIDDPWQVERPSSAPREVGAGMRSVAAWALGTVGAVLDLLGQRWWVGAVLLACATLAWEAALRVRDRAGAAAWPALLPFVALAVVVARPSIGRAPVLVALASVFVADAALVSWRPRRASRQRPEPVAGLALLPLAAAQVVWVRHGSFAVAGALVGVSLGLVEAHRHRPEAMAAAERLLARSVRRGASLVGLVVMAPLVALLLYLPGAIGRVLAAVVRRRRPSSSWRRRTVTEHEERREARLPFAPVGSAVRVRRTAFGAAVVALSAALLWNVIDDRLGADSPSDDLAGRVEAARREAERLAAGTTALPAPGDTGGTTAPPVTTGALTDQLVLQQLAQRRPFSQLAAYAGVAWGDDLQTEQQRLRDNYLVSDDVGLWTVADFAGTYTNVRDGERRTLEPSDCARCQRRTVWFIGGSAGFGFGQRDEHTVASELVRLAGERGVAMTVRNFSVPALTVYQEAEKIEARLRDEEPPDLVVFYDGYNDVSGTLLSSAVHGIRPDEPQVLDFADWAVLLESDLDISTVGTTRELGELVASKYRRVQSSVTAELDGAGVASMFAFQPDALASPLQYEAASPVWKLPEEFRRRSDEITDIAIAALQPSVIDVRRVFDAEQRPVFFDFSHTNELGARIVAEALYPHLSERLGL